MNLEQHGRPELQKTYRPEFREHQKETELQLYIKEMQKAAHIGYWCLETRGNVLHWSDEIFRIFELPIGTPINLEQGYEFFQAEHGDILKRLIQRCIEEHIPYDIELVLLTSSGKKKWVRCIGHPPPPEIAGKAILGVMQDITDYRRRIEDFKESQRRLNLTLSVNQVGIWDWDVTHDVLYWDDNMFRILELNKSDFTHNYSFLEGLLHPEDKQKMSEEIKKASLSNSGEFDTWFRIITPAGKLKYVAAKGRFNCRTQQQVWMTGVNWDITREKEQEKLIAKQQAQMIVTNRLSSLGEMSGGVAHEINNPLAIIMGRLYQLKRKLRNETTDFEGVCRSITSIEQTCERIVNIVNGLKTFSRNADHDPKEEIHLSKVITDVTSLMMEKLKHNAIELKLELDDKAYVYGNAIQLGQVFINLLNNSFDAVISLEERWIKICMQQTHEGVRIVFADSGKGIPPELLEKIFEPFFTTKGVGKGIGLGLSIAEGIIEDHHGRIFVDSDYPYTAIVIEFPHVADFQTKH